MYGQLDHAKITRFEQNLDAVNAGKRRQNSQICNLLHLAQAEDKGRDISCVREPIELSDSPKRTV